MEFLADFFEMGGYAAFVWPSLGLTAVVMGGLLFDTLYQLRGRRRRLAELEALGAARARRNTAASASPCAAAEAQR